MLDIKTPFSNVVLESIKLNAAGIVSFAANTLKSGSFVEPTSTIGEWKLATAAAKAARPLFVQDLNPQTIATGMATIVRGKVHCVTDQFVGTPAVGDELVVETLTGKLIVAADSVNAVATVIRYDSTTTPATLHYELI